MLDIRRDDDRGRMQRLMNGLVWAGLVVTFLAIALIAVTGVG